MNIRELVRTKTFWVGVVGIAAGIVDWAFGDASNGWTKIIGGVGLITARDAINKMTPPAGPTQTYVSQKTNLN